MSLMVAVFINHFLKSRAFALRVRSIFLAARRHESSPPQELAQSAEHVEVDSGEGES